MQQYRLPVRAISYGKRGVTDLAALKARNAARWADAKVTRAPAFQATARRLVVAKPRYQAVQVRTGVPWFYP
jgi:lysozyme family protein